MSGSAAAGVLHSVGGVMNEMDLLERHRNGSHEAFEELVRRHINWVHSVARRRLRDTHLAEDVTQASFTTLYRKPPRLKAGQTLSLWLFTVVNHAALDALRTEARRRRREAEAARMKGDLTTSEASQWAEFEPYLDELVGGLTIRAPVPLLPSEIMFADARIPSGAGGIRGDSHVQSELTARNH